MTEDTFEMRKNRAMQRISLLYTRFGKGAVLAACAELVWKQVERQVASPDR